MIAHIRVLNDWKHACFLLSYSTHFHWRATVVYVRLAPGRISGFESVYENLSGLLDTKQKVDTVFFENQQTKTTSEFRSRGGFGNIHDFL